MGKCRSWSMGSAMIAMPGKYPWVSSRYFAAYERQARTDKEKTPEFGHVQNSKNHEKEDLGQHQHHKMGLRV